MGIADLVPSGWAERLTVSTASAVWTRNQVGVVGAGPRRGGAGARLPRGMQYLACLLAAPGRDVGVGELAVGSSVAGAPQDVIDLTARAAYQARLHYFLDARLGAGRPPRRR